MVLVIWMLFASQLLAVSGKKDKKISQSESKYDYRAIPDNKKCWHKFCETGINDHELTSIFCTRPKKKCDTNSTSDMPSCVPSYGKQPAPDLVCEDSFLDRCICGTTDPDTTAKKQKLLAVCLCNVKSDAIVVLSIVGIILLLILIAVSCFVKWALKKRRKLAEHYKKKNLEGQQGQVDDTTHSRQHSAGQGGTHLEVSAGAGGGLGKLVAVSPSPMNSAVSSANSHNPSVSKSTRS